MWLCPLGFNIEGQCPYQFESECWNNCELNREDKYDDEDEIEYDDEANGNICPECGHDCSKKEN